MKITTIAQMIEAANITQAELSRLTGIDESSISRASCGLKLPTERQAKLVAALAEALDAQAKKVRLARKAVARISTVEAVEQIA